LTKTNRQRRTDDAARQLRDAAESRTKAREIAGRLAVCVAALLLGSAPAMAEPGVVTRDVDRLRVELAGVRQVLPAQVDDPQQQARLEVRLLQLEEELRRLTGRVEQLEFGRREVEGRLDQLIADLDARLRALEQGEAPPEGAQSQALPAPEARPAGSTAEALPEPPADERTLGQVPQSAILGLPRPDPSTIETPPRTTSLSPQAQYDSAMELLRAGDYGGAENGLQLFLDLNPDHPLASNAAYWLAETYYVRKNFAAAAAAFARNYRTYGGDVSKAPDNLLKLGMSLQGLGETDKACLSYTELSREFPNAPAHIEQAVDRERSRSGCG
jgi:tol-pal system protein YbgF